MDEARKRLLNVLPHIWIAVEMAKAQHKGGSAALAVVSKKADGSGQITAQFGVSFLQDVATVLGVGDRPGWIAPAQGE